MKIVKSISLVALCMTSLTYASTQLPENITNNSNGTLTINCLSPAQIDDNSSQFKFNSVNIAKGTIISDYISDYKFLEAMQFTSPQELNKFLSKGKTLKRN